MNNVKLWVSFEVLCKVYLSRYLKMPYFTSKDETEERRQTGEKRFNIFGHEKIIYIDIGDISQPTNDEKILKIRGLL